MLNLEELIDAAPERTPDNRATQDATFFLGENEVTVRFTELDSREWASCTMGNPPRKGLALDAGFGYNVTAATEAAAPLSGALVDGDETAPISAAHWARIFARLDAQGRNAITDAVFAVNESAHLKRLQAAANLSPVGSKRKPRSPAK